MLNDFQRFLANIAILWPTIGIKNDELDNLFNTLNGDKDINHPRELSSEAEKELALVERKLQDPRSIVWTQTFFVF